MNKTDPNVALFYLRGYNHLLTRQQFKTLRGQILAGDPDGAMRGLEKLLQQRRERSRDNQT